MDEDDGSVRPAQPSFYETTPSGPPRRHSPQRRPFPCNFSPRRPCKISCHPCPCRSVDLKTHSAITGSAISLYGYWTPECNGSVSPYAKTATAQRQSMNWLRVFRSPAAAYLGYGGGHEWLTRAPSEKCVARWGSAYDTMRRSAARVLVCSRGVLAISAYMFSSYFTSNWLRVLLSGVSS